MARGGESAFVAGVLIDVAVSEDMAASGAERDL
jgi:hypothetical protein